MSRQLQPQCPWRIWGRLTLAFWNYNFSNPGRNIGQVQEFEVWRNCGAAKETSEVEAIGSEESIEDAVGVKEGSVEPIAV